MFILLGGYPPFQGSSRSKQFERIRQGRYEFLDKYWGSVTDDAKSLIRSLLCLEPRKRLTADQALSHPWLCADPHQLHGSSLMDSVEQMREFNVTRKFKSAAQSVSHLLLFVTIVASLIVVSQIMSSPIIIQVIFLNRLNISSSDQDIDGNPDAGKTEVAASREAQKGSMDAVFSMRQKDKSLCENQPEQSAASAEECL